MAAAAPAPEDDPLAIALADAPDPSAPAAPPPPSDAAPGGGLAPRGGPLRGQRLTPPPPAPGTPPQPPLSLGDAIQQAQKNLLPSAASNISNTLHALAPWNWGEDVRGINQLGVGLESKLGLIDQGNPAEQAKDQAALNAVGKMYGDRYGSWEGFKRTLANDPFAIGSDIASVATLPLGGEGLLSKVPDATEAALMAGAGAARQGGALSDALLNSAVHVPAAMRAAGQIAKPVLTRARWLDPAYAGSQIAGGAVNAGRAVGNVPVIGRAIKGTIGAAAGNVAGGFFPIIGHTGGAIVGEHIAEGLGGPPGRLSAGVNAVSKTLPVWSTVGGTEPMSPTELPQGPGAAPPPAAAHPGAAPAAGPAGAASDDPFAAAMADSGLEGPVGPAPGPAAPPTPSSGLQGGPPMTGDPRNAKDVVRQAEGGFNQPVGYMPGKGSARGAYQMIDGTYANNLRKYHPEIARGMSNAQISAFRNTPQGWALNETMGGQMVEDEITQLRHEGIIPTPDNVATYHMLGNTHLLHADPSTPIEQVTGADQRASNASAFRNVRTAGDFLNWMHGRNARAVRQLGQRDDVPFADGGRVGYAEGGNVIDMTDALMRRAEAHHRAGQQDTKPMLGLSDDIVAKALRVAQAGI